MFEALEMFDRSLLLMINSFHTPLLDTFMWYMSETWPTVIIVIFAAYIINKKYNLKKAVSFLVGCAIVVAFTDITANTIKHTVKRYRPTQNLEIQKQVRILNGYSGGTFGFASGHSANTFGAITFIFFCLHWFNKTSMLLIFLYPAIVGYSRIYLGVHYPSDVFFGMLLGLLAGWIGFKLIDRHFLYFNAERVT
jgi:undecaprenyl-diphosphatase